LDEKVERIKEIGADAVILIDFTEEFGHTPGEVFIRTLASAVNMRFLAVGRDFKCGAGGAFGVPAITALCTSLGVEVYVVPPVMDGGLPVSSSRIRAALASGDGETAARLLGRPLLQNCPDAPDA
jgi:riboflavin kinase/FMN adenylyltransferase